MPSSSDRSPVDFSGAIVPYTDSPTPRRTKLPIRPPLQKRKRPPSPSSSSTLALPSLKKTRFHPDLTLCHACKRRTTPSKPLRPLPSQWRVALLCPRCYLTIRAGESCSYCFARCGIAVPQTAGVVQCRRCRSRVHLACVPRMRGYASLSHDLDPHLFTCVDCAAIPDFFRAGRSAVNRVSLDCAERASRSAAANKAEEASRARSRAIHKSEAAPCAVVLARELLVPENDGYVTPSMEIDQPSSSGDAEAVRGAKVIEQLGNIGDLPRSQKLHMRTYSRRRGSVGRSRGKVLFLFTYSLKRKKASAMENGRTPAAGEQESLTVDDQFLRAEVEYDLEKSSVPNGYCRKPSSELSLEKEELEEMGDKGYGGQRHLAPRMAHGYLKTYLRGFKIISSQDEGEPTGIRREDKPEQPSAPLKPSDIPDRYLNTYIRKFHLNGVDDGAKSMKTKTSAMTDRYVLKYSRKNRLRLNADNEQVVTDSRLGNHWSLRPCTAAGNADAPQEAGRLSLDEANVNPSSGSSSLNEKP